MVSNWQAHVHCLFCACVIVVASFGTVVKCKSPRVQLILVQHVDAVDCPATLATAFLQHLAAFCGVTWDYLVLLGKLVYWL